MPCYDPPDLYDELTFGHKLSKRELTKMLCEAMKIIEDECLVGDDLKGLSKELSEWWTAHKKFDGLQGERR